MTDIVFNGITYSVPDDLVDYGYADIVESGTGESVPRFVAILLDALADVQRARSTTSATSKNGGLTGTQTWVLAADLNPSRGQPVVVARTSDPATVNYYGTVTAYDAGTKTVTVAVETSAGSSGPYTDWTVTLVGRQGPAGTTLPVADSTALVKGSADTSKQVRIEADGLTAAATRVWTAQDKNITVAGLDDVMAVPRGRLTLTSLTPVTTADVTAATSVYYTPHAGNLVPVYTGTLFTMRAFAELTLALNNPSHAANTNYDVFAFDDAGTLRVGTGPAWSSATARGTGAGTTELQLLTGFYTNKVSMTARNGGSTYSVSANQGTYLGTVRTTGSAGQTEDSEAKRYVWNAYNRRLRTMAVLEATDTWNYSTASFRQMNNSAANQLDMVIGLPEDAVVARVQAYAVSSTATVRSVYAGIGLDSTTASWARLRTQAQCSNAATGAPSSQYCGHPGLGRHFLAALEYGGGADTQTWFGDNGAPATLQTGITGELWA